MRVNFVVFLLSCCFVKQSLTLVSDYGETCEKSDECIDHRMDCLPDEHNVTRCYCARFHTWFNTSLGCIQTTNISVIISEVVVVKDNIGKITKEHDWVLRGPTYAGYFFTIVLIIAVALVLIFCVYAKKTDRELTFHVREMSRQSHAQQKSKPVVLV